ncbi:hypothetical protein UYSO10_1194 [Kosakonia radicincitans]|nr:hypothetical protein UYSO10_1194 [Kosakonia radicincitans]
MIWQIIFADGSFCHSIINITAQGFYYILFKVKTIGNMLTLIMGLFRNGNYIICFILFFY